MNSSSFYLKNQRYEKLKKQLLEQKCLFVDSQFPTTLAVLGSAAESLTESEAVEWKRPRVSCFIILPPLYLFSYYFPRSFVIIRD